MPFFTGMASALAENVKQARQTEWERSEKQKDRENAVLQHLTTSEDPEIAAMGVHGLLSQAAGRPLKGVRGMLGEMAGNPALPKIQAMIAAGRQVPGQPGSAAQSTGSPTTGQPLSPLASSPTTGVGTLASPEGGGERPTAGPMTPTPKPATPPPGADVSPAGGAGGEGGPAGALGAAVGGAGGEGGAGGAGTGSITVPRRVFLSPSEQLRANQEATIGGKISAFRSGLAGAKTDEEKQLVRAEAGIHTPVTGQFMGNIQDAQGNWFRQERFINPATGVAEMQRSPIATPTGLQAKPQNRVMADPDTGRPGLFRILPDGTHQKLGDVSVRNGYATYTDPDDGHQYSVPLPATFARPTGGGGAAAPPPGAGASAAAVAPSTAPGARPASGPPPAAAGSGPGRAPGGAAAAAPRGGGAGAPGARPAGVPAGAIPRGRAQTPANQVEGAIIGPNGDPMAAAALYDPKQKKYFDPQDPTKEFAGYIPGKEGTEVSKLFAQSRATESTIDRAIAALKARGLDKNNDPLEIARIVKQYKEGTSGDDPTSAAVAALTDFAKIQGGSAYVQGTRSYKYVQDIQQHLPVLPSYRAADAAVTLGLHGGTGPRAAQWVGGEGAHGWDSGAQMVEKLQLAKQTLEQVRQGSRTATGKVPERAIGAGGGPSNGGRGGGAAAAPPPGAGTASGSSGTPDLSGLQAGHGRTFNSGPFAGQTWTVDASGKPQQVK